MIKACIYSKSGFTITKEDYPELFNDILDWYCTTLEYPQTLTTDMILSIKFKDKASFHIFQLLFDDKLLILPTFL